MLESSLSKTFPFWPHLTSSPHSRGPRIKFTNANFHLGTYKPFASYWQETTDNFSPDASRPHLRLGKRWPNTPGWCPTWRLERVLIKQKVGKWWGYGMHCNNNNHNNLKILSNHICVYHIYIYISDTCIPNYRRMRIRWGNIKLLRPRTPGCCGFHLAKFWPFPIEFKGAEFPFIQFGNHTRTYIDRYIHIYIYI